MFGPVQDLAAHLLMRFGTDLVKETVEINVYGVSIGSIKQNVLAVSVAQTVHIKSSATAMTKTKGKTERTLAQSQPLISQRLSLHRPAWTGARKMAQGMPQETNRGRRVDSG